MKGEAKVERMKEQRAQLERIMARKKENWMRKWSEGETRGRVITRR
jgi:hypothetical protein